MTMPKVVGVDLGGTNLRAARVDASGEILKKLKTATPETPEELLEALEGLIREAADGAPDAAVVASAGLVDEAGEAVLRSPNLAAVEGLPLRSKLSEALGAPVRLLNDASAAALGEAWKGAGRDLRRFVLLTLGTGVGGGVIHDGRLLDIPAELGHIAIDPAGPLCGCGMRGCLETFASATAIVDRVVRELSEGRESLVRDCCEGNFYRVTARMIYETALEGDILCRKVLREAGERLGVGVANLVNVFGPEAVLLGGGLLGAWDFLVPGVEARLRKAAFPELTQGVEIRRAAFADEAGLLGAGRLALDLCRA